VRPLTEASSARSKEEARRHIKRYVEAADDEIGEASPDAKSAKVSVRKSAILLVAERKINLLSLFEFRVGNPLNPDLLFWF